MLVDSSGVGSMRWVVGVGAAGSVEGLVACSEGVRLSEADTPVLDHHFFVVDAWLGRVWSIGT